MGSRRKYWVREVLAPGVIYGVAAGITLNGLVIWCSPRAFRWQDYALSPVVGAVLGVMLAWALSGLAGIVRYLRDR
jgi:hypothetical protein